MDLAILVPSLTTGQEGELERGHPFFSCFLDNCGLSPTLLVLSYLTVLVLDIISPNTDKDDGARVQGHPFIFMR